MSRRRRAGRSTITMDVEIDMAEIETDDLIAELRSRDSFSENEQQREELEEIHRQISRGHTADALSLIERLIWPKWKTPEQCAADLANLKKVAA